MFGKSNNHFQVGTTTIISKSTEVVGDIHFTGSLEIEGTVRGNVIAEENSGASVRVLNKGKVIGKLQAPSVIINGEVDGDVHSSKHIELAAKAMVKGNVYYHFLEVVKGAQVNGNMVHDGEAVIVEEKPATPQANKQPQQPSMGGDKQAQAAKVAKVSGPIK